MTLLANWHDCDPGSWDARKLEWVLPLHSHTTHGGWLVLLPVELKLDLPNKEGKPSRWLIPE